MESRSAESAWGVLCPRGATDRMGGLIPSHSNRNCALWTDGQTQSSERLSHTDDVGARSPNYTEGVIAKTGVVRRCRFGVYEQK